MDDQNEEVVHAIYNQKRHTLRVWLNKAGFAKATEFFPVTFESPNMIQTGDGTCWNREGVATDSEKKLQDENQALRDQVALLERQVAELLANDEMVG